MNRLGSATSPYLLQHAHNPVDWWPWGEEAFAAARERDVPVLISVGYAACHWCHVMAHESFESERIAALLNESVVSIKVDREERPDVDAVYMTATQAMSGQGGWPMTVFATPEGEPFFCGTYFPPQHFEALVRAVAQAWRDQRDDVRAQGAAVVTAVAQAQGTGLERMVGAVAPEVLDAGARVLIDEHDPVHGGFGGAPKFPPHMAMLFLMRHHQRTRSAQSLEVVRHTAEAMARGGIYDQLAGGFARYSVDERWLVPHFEKMLYDNALLLRVYTMLWRLTSDPLALRTAAETAEFLMRDLFDGRAFVSSLDADTGGVEGSTYVWKPNQLEQVLGAEDGRFAADLFDVTVAGNFENNASVLRLARDIDGAADEVRARWMDVRAKLLKARLVRPQPARDDKVIAAWCGLAITGLVEFALTVDAMLGRAPYTTLSDSKGPFLTTAGRAAEHAVAAAAYLADVHLIDGRLRRASRDGKVGEPAGVLDDYGSVAEALCAVHQLTGDGRWLADAGVLLDAAIEHFIDADGRADGVGGIGIIGIHDTADDAQRLVARPADPTDNATPSGLSSLASALVAYSALTGERRYREVAEAALETVGALMARHPRFGGYSCAAAEALLAGPYEIAIVEPSGDRDGLSQLVSAARRHAPPGSVVVVGRADQPGVPLLASRPTVDGRATAYVCRGFVCDRPVTTEADLVALLAR